MKKMALKMVIYLLGSGWLRWLLAEYIFPLIDKLVAKTSTQYDDEAAHYVKEMLLSLAEMVENDI